MDRVAPGASCSSKSASRASRREEIEVKGRPTSPTTGSESAWAKVTCPSKAPKPSIVEAQRCVRSETGLTFTQTLCLRPVT
jgi:hypothetical protein